VFANHLGVQRHCQLGATFPRTFAYIEFTPGAFLVIVQPFPCSGLNTVTSAPITSIDQPRAL